MEKRTDDRRMDKGIVYLLFIIAFLLIFIHILFTIVLFGQIIDKDNKIYGEVENIEKILNNKEVVICNYK